jgi:oligoendopeptidase F
MTTASELKPTTRNRAEIPEHSQWDLGHIYPGWEAWEADLVKLQGLMSSYQALEGTLAEGPRRILEASLQSDALGQLAYRVYQYPALMQSQDTRDNEVQARLERVRLALAAFRQATAWYTPELLRIPEATMQEWLDATPELAPYRFGIEESYRMQRHVLDEDGERLLAFAGPFAGTPAHTYSMMADADVRFPTVTLSDGDRNGGEPRQLHAGAALAARPGRPRAAVQGPLLGPRRQPQHLRRDLQRRPAEGLVHGARPPLRLLARGQARRRQHPGGSGGEPDRHRPRRQRAPASATTGCGAACSASSATATSTPTCRFVEVHWPLPYGAVARTLIDSVALFGEAYQRTVERALGERWIDVYENEGKRSGAFSSGVYGVHPYMLLNYADTLNDAFTVAHEMGHTMHTVLSHESQPFATSSYSIFVAEVASMTNESLFLDRLLADETDPARRVTLLQHAIDDIAAGFYRQAMFADFELRAHREVEADRPVTAEVLQRIYLEVPRGFFGSSLDDQEWYRNTWARIPHFFGSPFYVFQYATSKAAAALLHRRMTSGDGGVALAHRRRLPRAAALRRQRPPHQPAAEGGRRLHHHRADRGPRRRDGPARRPLSSRSSQPFRVLSFQVLSFEFPHPPRETRRGREGTQNS